MASLSLSIPLTPPLSQAFVSCWVYQPSLPNSLNPQIYRVLPDGCADLILKISLSASNASRLKATLLLSGVLSHYKLVELKPNTLLYGLHFRPGWIEPILGINPLQLPPVPDLAERQSARLQPLVQQLKQVYSFQEAETVLFQGLELLVERGIEQAASVHPCLLEALRLLEETGGPIRMETLTQEVALNTRTLHRGLSRALGLPPKSFARILRFQSALASLEKKGRLQTDDLAVLAIERGYCDQAHMTHEFRNLSGLTPSGLLR